ncbi:MAG: TonB-dependent receptor plug domain-containing protein [bacterium]|nr:TonB-dependent receptor plug domain-containing protein [bacterium]
MKIKRDYNKLISLALLLSFVFLFPQLSNAEPVEAAREESSEDISELINMPFEDLLKVTVVTASNKKETLFTAPSNITIITERQIREWGLRNMRDLLKKVSGYTVDYDRDEWSISSRGNVTDFSGPYLILIDGHSMNNIEAFGAGHVTELPMDLSGVKKVEIIKGPGSAVWGSQALAGVINIITKTPEDLDGKNYVVSAAVGMWGTYKANTQIGFPFKDGGIMILGSYAQSNGKTIGVDKSSSIANTVTEPQYGDLPPRGRYSTVYDRFDPSYKIQVKGKYKNININSFAFRNTILNRHWEIGRENWRRHDRYFIEGSVTENIGKNFSFTPRISMDDMRESWFSEDYASSCLNWTENAITTALDFNLLLFKKELDIKGGGNFRYSISGPNTTISDLDITEKGSGTTGTNLSSYLKDKNISAHLTLKYDPSFMPLSFVGGSNADYNTKRGGDQKLVFSPRAGIMWSPMKTSVLKLLFNSGFLRPYNFQANYYNQSDTVESSRMYQGELLWIQQIDSLHISLNLFWQELKDFIITRSSFDGGWLYDNVGDYEAKGCELDLNFNPAHFLNLYGNVSFCMAKIKNIHALTPVDSIRNDDDGDLINYPVIMGNIGGTWRATLFGGNFFVSPGARIQAPTTYRSRPNTYGATWDHDGDDGASTPEVTVPAGEGPAEYDKTKLFVYLDLNIGYEFEYISVYVSGHNLLNETGEHYITVWNGTYEQPGIYIEGKISVKI